MQLRSESDARTAQMGAQNLERRSGTFDSISQVSRRPTFLLLPVLVAAFLVVAGFSTPGTQEVQGNANPSPPKTAGTKTFPRGPQTREFYAATNGTSSGDGSITNPWNLQTALDQPSTVHAGDIIWVRGGTYTGNYMSWLQGTATAPILVRAYPGERAMIDRASVLNGGYGPLTVMGEYVWFWGLEVTNSDPTRVMGETDTRLNGLNARAAHIKFINMIVHDNTCGVGFWMEASDSELYGSLIYNNGYQGPNWGMGHGVYVMNDTGSKLIADNIIFNQFGYGIHGYGESGQYHHNITMDGNTVFNAGALANDPDNGNNILVGGTTNPASGIVVSNNYTYFPASPSRQYWSVALGYSNDFVDQDIAVQDNYFIGSGPVNSFKEWQNMTVTGNTFYSHGSNKLIQLDSRGVGTSGYQWNNNTYYGGSSSSPFRYSGSSLSFSNWRSNTGLDSSSQYNSGRPTGTHVFVQPNDYETGRANITVYNWDNLSTVNVNVGSILSPGERFEVRNAQNYFAGPVLEGVYDGNSIRLPMTGLSVAAPYGWSAAPATGPGFNVFVLLGNTECNSNFYDVPPSEYYAVAVRYLYCHGIIAGYSDGSFRPNSLTTRGQLAKMVVLAEGWTISTPSTPTFRDVPASSAFYDYVETAYGRGVISGYTCGSNCLEFRPGTNITRAQLCKILVQAEGWTTNTQGGPHFSDVPYSDPFYDYVETAVNQSVITGYSDGTFRPGNSATRGQICKILYNALTR